MPTYSITGPDGKTYSIDGPEGATREQVIYMIQRRLNEQSKPQGFLGSFKQSATSLGDVPEAAKFALADSSKRQPRKDFLNASAPKGATTSWDDVKDLATFWEFSKELAGGSAGFIAPAAAVAKAASYIPVIGPYARGIGLATYGLQYLVDQLGTQAQVQQEAIDKGESYAPTSLARAASGAYQSTVLDVMQLDKFSKVMSKFPFVGKLIGDAGEQGAKEAEEQLVDAYLAGTLKPSGQVMKGVAKGLVFEVPQEIAQTAIDRLQSRQSLTDEDAMKAYKEAAIGAAILGGPMGAAEGALGYYGAKKKAMESDPEEAAQQAQAQAQAQPQQAPEEEVPVARIVPPRGLPPPGGPGAGPNAGPGAGPGGPGAGPNAGPGAGPTPPPPFDDDDLNIARDALIGNKGKKRLTAGGMRYALSAAMRKAGRDSKMKRMDEILRHLTRDGFIRPDDNGNVTFGYVEPEPDTFDAEAEEVTPAGPTLGIGQAPPVEAPVEASAATPVETPAAAPVVPVAPGTQGELDFGGTGTGAPPAVPVAPQGPEAPQGAAPQQGEFEFGAAAADEATARAQRRAELIKQKNVTEDILNWDSKTKHGRSDLLFDGWAQTLPQRDAEGARASQYQAHGMAKAINLSTATSDLVNLLKNGLDPNRRGGVLDTAPLGKSADQSGLHGATASGTAYGDGPFQIVAKKGAQSISNVNDIGGVLVNEAAVDSGVVEHLRSLFPNLIVEPYSNISSFLDQMDAQATTTETAPTTTETATAPTTQRKTLSLKKKPAPVAEPVVEENYEPTELNELDFADAATAGMQVEPVEPAFDPVEAVNAARQKAYDAYPGEGVPARALRAAFMKGYSAGGEKVTPVFNGKNSKAQQKAYEEGQTFAQQQQTQTTPPTESTQGRGVPDTGRTGTSVQKPVPTTPPKSRTDGESKSTGVDVTGEPAERPAPRETKVQRPLTPADKARIAATRELINTFRYLVKTDRLTADERERFGAELILARTSPDYPYKEKFPEIRKFFMEAANRAGTDNIESDNEEASIDEMESENQDVSREYNEDEETDYENAFEDERGRPKELRFSRTADERWYYSALKRFFENVKQVKATVGQWLGILSNAVGIKPEEIEWTGIEDWLKSLGTEPNRVVSKEEILSFLDNSGVQVEVKEFKFDLALDLAHRRALNALNSFTIRMHNKYRRASSEDLDKFEHVLNSEERMEKSALVAEVAKTNIQRIRAYPKYHGIRIDKEGGKNYREFILSYDTPDQLFFDAVHFSKINPLVFVRVDTRVNSAGQKILFVHEIQSDWGQDVREWGIKGHYESLPTRIEAIQEVRPGLWRYKFKLTEREDPVYNFYNAPRDWQFIHADSYADAHDRVVDYLSNTFGPGNLSNGPFIKSTEAWTSLAIKKLMAIAVNEGYDKIAFSNGTQVSDVYNRSNTYNTVEFSYSKSDATYTLKLWGGNGLFVGTFYGVKEDNLIDFLGNEKIVNEVIKAREQLRFGDYDENGVSEYTPIISDEMIKVPAKGMVGYYNKILPKVIRKVSSKLGGTVSTSDFHDIASEDYTSRDSFRSATNPTTSNFDERSVVTLDVDQKLIDNVQKKVPLFRAASKGGMNAKDVQGVVDSVVKGWTNAPPIKVVQSISDLPKGIRDSIAFGVGGVYADGTVYLVADGLNSAQRVQATLLHESLAHFGLREEFGKGLDPLLDNIYKTNPAMRAAVDKWLKENPDTYADLSQDEQRRAAMEEVFAEQSESGPVKNMGLRAALSRIMSFIKDFLRRMGFNIAYSDADVANILAKAHDRVISGGKKGVEGAATRFSRTRVPLGANETPQETITRLQKELDEAYSRDSAFTKAMKFRFTHKGFEWLAKRVQNDRRPAKVLEDALRANGELQLEGDLNGTKFNNLYTQLMLSSQRAFHYMVTKINKPLGEFKKSIREYAVSKNIDVDAALARLHTYAMALHEPERRMAKYIQNVPLNNINRVRIPGLPEEGTFADHREFIMRQLYKIFISKQKAQQYRNILDDIIAGRYGQALDANGVSGMLDSRGNTVTGLSLDPMSDDYRVIGGYSQAQFAEFRRQYQAEKQEVDKIFKHMKDVQERTIDLNKIANYWSPQVDNIRNFYGWEHYVPFKSRKGSNISADDDKLDFSSERLGVGGYEYLDVTQQFSGRMTDSENPLLQVMMESASAAMRAGRHGVTQSLVNLHNQGHVKARKYGTIKFEDRYKALIDLDSYLGNNPDKIRPRIIFHYKPEGEIEIWAINDNEIAESIRRAYQTPNPVWQAVNRVTSFFGHLHTRYNPAFHLYNYLRDALHNAWLIGTDVGKEARAKYIEQIAMLTANGGLIKAGNVSRLYANNDIAAIEAMWKNPDGSVKDQFVKDIYDFLRVGGRTTFIQSLSMQKEAEQLLKDLRGSGLKDKALDIRDAGLKWFDIAADMFEFTSRVAAFSVVKADRRAKGMSEEEANIDAAAFAKELANFEQVGLWGQKLGAFFMFFRPSATGAVRNIDSLRPAWQSEQAYLDSVPASAKNTPEKLAKLRQDYRRRRENAINSLKMLVAVGAAMYLLALALAEDDEAERNEVATDDKALWTRNLRLPLRWLGYEGDNPWINIPWGFGFGAFGAAGAQTMALVTGGQSVKEFMGNTVNIALDSFLPIPVSRVNPFENPGIWLISSGMPSLARPIVDFQMNMDSLGRQIYSNRQTKYGDAYTSGINNPEHINALARWMADTFDIDVGPNTLNFWASNYADAVSRVAGAAYDVNLALGGEKELSAKVALMPISSFLGAKSNYDGRQFAKMQSEADDFIAKLNRLENTNPEKLQNFLQENPNAYEIKYVYNKMVNGQLRKIATERKRILSDPNLPAGERRERAKQLNYVYNASKRSLMEAMSAYGLDY